MAAKNRTRYSAGEIARDIYHWGVLFRGRRDALVAVGICNAAPFPGDNGREPTRTFTTKDPRGNEILISRRGKYNFVVYRDGHSQLEAIEFARIEIERGKQQESKQQKEREERDSEENTIDCAEYLERLFKTAGIGATMPQLYAAGKWGWRLSDPGYQELVRAGQQYEAAVGRVIAN